MDEVKPPTLLVTPRDAEILMAAEKAKRRRMTKTEVVLFRRDWRSAMTGRGFLGRNGRPKWTGKTALRKPWDR